MYSGFHSLRHDPHSRIADVLQQKSVLWEVWQCIKLCLGVCRVVYSFSRSLNHRERKSMVVHVQIVPFVDVFQWLGLSIEDVLVLVSKYFVW